MAGLSNFRFHTLCKGDSQGLSGKVPSIHTCRAWKQHLVCEQCLPPGTWECPLDQILRLKFHLGLREIIISDKTQIIKINTVSTQACVCLPPALVTPVHPNLLITGGWHEEGRCYREWEPFQNLEVISEMTEKNNQNVFKVKSLSFAKHLHYSPPDWQGKQTSAV